VTADTQRFAGVVSADHILATVKDVRVSIAESISIREAEAAHAYEPLPEAEGGYEPLAEPEQEYGSDEVYDQMAEAEQPSESDQVFDHMAEPEAASQAETGDEGGTEDTLVSVEYPTEVVESGHNGDLQSEDHRIPDQQDEGRQANGEAKQRRGSSVLQ
jgi:hypothetical protein